MFVSLINFLIINLLLIACSFILNFFLSKNSKNNVDNQIYSIIVIYLSLITFLLISLGLLGAINLLNVSIVTYTFSFFCISFASWKRVLRQSLKINSSKTKISLKPLALLFGPIGTLALAKLFVALFKIPVEFDALVYHLPIVSEWFQTGSLMNIYYTAFSGPLAYYPSNFDLIYLWSIFPLNNDYFLNLLNFPIIFCIPFLIYSICRNYKIKQKISLFVSALPLYLPVFFQQLGTVFVDGYFVLNMLFSIYFLQEIYKNHSLTKNSILFGLSLGLFVGTKYLGLPFAIIIWLWFLLSYFTKKILSIKNLILSSISFLITGAFFYVRNFLDSGNPIFPVDISAFGIKILEGYPSASSKLSNSAIWDNLSSLSTYLEVGTSYFTMTDIPGLIIFLSVFFSLIYFIVNLFKKFINKDILIILITSIVFFILYLKAPYSYRDLIHNVRYAMPFLLIGTINLAYLLNKFTKYHSYFYLICIMAFSHSLIFLLLQPDHKTFFNLWIIDLYSEYFLVLILGFVFGLSTIYLKKQIIKYNLTLISSVCLICLVVNFAFNKREFHKKDFYEVYYPESNIFWGVWNSGLWIEKNAPTSKIAYSGFNLHYPLIGNEFKRSASYININDCLKCRYVDYKNSLDSIRRDPSFNDWFSNLQKNKIEYIVLDYSLYPSLENYEQLWIDNHPEFFEITKTFNTASIYKLK
ncbi:hypothetical protein CL656_00675 [bacterium]|nr:hypothetical protein [bacterium]